MRLRVFRHLWGLNGPRSEIFPAIRAMGYCGIEGRMPSSNNESFFKDLLNRNDLLFIPKIFTEGDTVAEHIESFAEQLMRCAEMRPYLVNANSGRDAFTRKEASEFFAAALRIEEDLGVRVAHETHRSRVLYNPFITRELIREFPTLKLCADYSHWVLVCERLLETESEIIRLCNERAIHIHARVGSPQTPQVSDPRAPEFAELLEVYEGWWSNQWALQKADGAKEVSLTPEFGPPPYQPILPYTRQPVANLEEICDWMADRLQERFSKEYPPPPKDEPRSESNGYFSFSGSYNS